MRHQARKFFLFSLLLAAVLAAGLSVHAQPIDVSKIKKVPRFTMLSQEAFEAQTDLFEEHPEGDQYLAYQIRLPKGWRRLGMEMTAEEAEEKEKQRAESEEKVLSRRILGRVARYGGEIRLDALSYLEVKALELSYNISTKNWFLNYILSNSYTLEGIEEVGENRIEAVYVLVEGDVSYVVRSVAEINGPRMVIASYYLPETRWNEEKAMQEKVIQSFRFLQPETVKLELTRTYSFLNLLRFEYPVSWRLIAPDIKSIDTMETKLMNTDKYKNVIGEIDIRIISTEIDTTLAEEVALLRSEMTERGLVTGELIETPEVYEFQDHIYFSRVETYIVKDPAKKMEDYEMWLAVLAEDRYYYIITMLSIGRNADFYTWARNSEAFQLVVESLRP